MKVKIKQRPMRVGQPEPCGCCVRLDWRGLKKDKQLLKEAIKEIEND